MTYVGLFVDDEDEEYAEQLSTPGVLEIDFLPVEEVMALAAKIRAAAPQVVALDYRLDESAANLRPDQTFKGSALAQHLRDRAIEAPESDMAVVLVSAEAKVRALYRPDKTAHDLFDRVYIKEEVNAHRACIRAEIRSLASAYNLLRSQAVPYNIAALMNATGEDLEVIGVQELRLKFEEARAPHLLVRVFFGLLIDRSGPLVDRDDVCAFLGVARDEGDKLKSALIDCRYNGLFGEAWPRWWSHRLENWAHDMFGRRPTGLPASERARILSERLKMEFRPALSPWSGSPLELVAIACACCRRGVEMSHTVAVFEAALPKLSARRRICWDCVQTDKYESLSPPLVIDEIDADLAEEVKGMPRPSGTGAPV